MHVDHWIIFTTKCKSWAKWEHLQSNLECWTSQWAVWNSFTVLWGLKWLTVPVLYLLITCSIHIKPARMGCVSVRLQFHTSLRYTSDLREAWSRKTDKRLKERENTLYSHSYQRYRVRKVLLEETDDLVTGADLLEFFKGHEECACERPVLKKPKSKGLKSKSNLEIWEILEQKQNFCICMPKVGLENHIIHNTSP